jgi:hypothetical protein
MFLVIVGGRPETTSSNFTIKVNAMKTYRGVKVYIHIFLTSALDGDK